MRNIITVFLLFIGFSICNGKVIARNFKPSGDDASIKKAQELVKNKKYNSAFKLLESADSTNSNPDVVLLKEDIVLNYFVESIEHQMFSLKDIGADENIEDYRGKDDSSDIYVFEANVILDKLIKQYPTNYKLYEGLADFYESAHSHYGGNWLVGEDTLNDLIRYNYQMAIDHGVGDYHAYFRVAVFMLQDDKTYRKAIEYLLKSYGMNKDYPDAPYNLAYAYLMCDSRDTALMYAKIAEGEYGDPSLKGDAERMIGEIYGEKNDTANAIKYYQIANNTDSGNYYNLRALLNIYVITNNPKRKEAVNAFYNLAPENPTIYNDLSEIYSDSLKGFELIAFYKSQLPAYKNQDTVLGALYLYLANEYFFYDKKQVKDYVQKARETFSIVFDKDDKVFDVLDKILAASEGKGK